MPLHPDLAAFLDMANTPAATRPRVHQMTAQQARQAYDLSTLALDEDGAALATQELELPVRDGSRIGARLYRGAAPSPARPTVLFFHGGGYVLGNLESHDSLCRDLAAGAACEVLAVDYRRAPEHRFPTAFLDAQDALCWLRTHGAGHGLDGQRLAVAGDSVGASLAAALCIAEREANRPQPLLQLLLYPCAAAFQDSDSHRRLASGYLLEHDTLQWMFGHYLRGDADRLDWRFAPLQAADLRGLAPAHLVLAEYDPLLDEGLLYARRLQAAGVPAGQAVYKGMVHDFARLGNVTRQAAALRRDLARLLSGVLHEGAPAAALPPPARLNTPAAGTSCST